MNKLKFSLQPETGRLSESDAKRYFSTFGLAACVLILVHHLSSYLLSSAVYLFAPWLLDYEIFHQLFSVLTIYGIAFPCFLLVIRRLPTDTMAPSALGTKNWWRALCIALAFMMVGNYIGNFVISYFVSITGISQSNPVATAASGESILISLLFVAIVRPILEELVFRKVVCDHLLPLGEGYAIILSAVFFGLVHGNFYQFFYAVGAGMLFALIYVKTGRLRYSISYHIIINAFSGVLATWLIDRVSPWMTEEGLTELLGMAETDPAGLFRIWQIYLLPLLAYEVVFLVAAVLGVVFLIKEWKKIRLIDGLLPPPKENRVANVFCSPGIAAALAVFAGAFLWSLL